MNVALNREPMLTSSSLVVSRREVQPSASSKFKGIARKIIQEARTVAEVKAQIGNTNPIIPNLSLPERLQGSNQEGGVNIGSYPRIDVRRGNNHRSLLNDVEPISPKKVPMKTYAHLKTIEEEGIPYIYTPFDQGALVNILDPTWKGSCNILAHTWMYKKTRDQDFLKPIFYSITDSHLPHPMIIGENLPEQEEESVDIQRIQSIFEKHSYSWRKLCENNVDEMTGQKGIESLIEFLKNAGSRSVLIHSTVYAVDPAHSVEVIGHACAFVKRGDQCSWYDPNYGEVTFEQFDDFGVWFKKEVMEGTLVHLLNDALKRKKEMKNGKVFVSDIFPQPTFSNSLANEGLLSRVIINRRNQAMRKRESCEVRYIDNYELMSYKPNKKRSRLPEIDDIAFM